MNKNKNRGKYFENRVSNSIKDKWMLTEFDVHRNQSSGTFHTEFGDIFFKELPIIIECKYQKSWDSKHLFNWKKPITDWWEQLYKDVESFRQKKNQEPLYFLVISKPRYETLAIFDIANIEENDSPFSINLSNPSNLNVPYFIYIKQYNKIAFNLDDILSYLYEMNNL